MQRIFSIKGFFLYLTYMYMFVLRLSLAWGTTNTDKKSTNVNSWNGYRKDLLKVMESALSGSAQHRQTNTRCANNFHQAAESHTAQRSYSSVQSLQKNVIMRSQNSMHNQPKSMLLCGGCIHCRFPRAKCGACMISWSPHFRCKKVTYILAESWKNCCVNFTQEQPFPPLPWERCEVT